jgi:hypothetical protein
MRELATCSETQRFAASFADSPSARAKVASFVGAVYHAEYGVAPPLADAYACVTRAGDLVSCVGLDWPGPDGRFRIERAYHLERDRLELPLAQALQFGRWASRAPEAGVLAVYAAAEFALARGKTLALVEHSRLIHRYCQRLGLAFREVPHAELDLAEIPEPARPTYAKRDMEPFLLDLEQARTALRAHAADLLFRP